MKLELIVTEAQAGRMVKDAVKVLHLSGGLWKRIKWNGRVTVNGEDELRAGVFRHGFDERKIFPQARFFEEIVRSGHNSKKAYKQNGHCRSVFQGLRK